MANEVSNLMIRCAEVYCSADDYSQLEYRCVWCDMPFKSHFLCMKHFYNIHLKMAHPNPPWKRNGVTANNWVDNRMHLSSSNPFDTQSYSTLSDEPPLSECHICRALVLNNDDAKRVHMHAHGLVGSPPVVVTELKSDPIVVNENANGNHINPFRSDLTNNDTLSPSLNEPVERASQNVAVASEPTLEERWAQAGNLPSGQSALTLKQRIARNLKNKRYRIKKRLQRQQR